jgi:lauroyl/myristoyl acyltransferase
MARLHGRLTGGHGGNAALTEALMLDHWMRELTRFGEFPIPYVLHGRERIEQARAEGPVVYCWTHLPLTEIPLRALVDSGLDAPVVVSDPGNITPEGNFRVFGSAKRMGTILANRQSMVRMRNVLREGTSVVCLADAYLGAPLLRHPLSVAGNVGATVLFQWAERKPDGMLEVTFREAPHPKCENEAAIDANLEFLRVENRRVLQGLGFRDGDVT